MAVLRRTYELRRRLFPHAYAQTFCDTRHPYHRGGCQRTVSLSPVAATDLHRSFSEAFLIFLDMEKANCQRSVSLFRSRYRYTVSSYSMETSIEASPV